MHKHLRLAMASAATYDCDSSLEFNLCAVIVRGGAIISIGFNKHSTNAFVEHYADVSRGNRDWCSSTHAEMDAVLRVRSKTDLRGAKLFVARRRKSDGSPAIARPCEICQQILYSYGIKRAYYTIGPNEFGQMKISSPGNIQDSIVTSGDLLSDVND